MAVNAVVKSQFNDLRGLLERAKAQIGTALPATLGITPDRIVRVALTCARQNPALLRADKASFLGTIMQSAQLGLELGGALGQAYPVPYKGKVQFILGYKGMLALAFRSGMVTSLSAHKVCEHDEFEFTYGLEQQLDHRPRMDGPRGEAIAYYAVAQIKGGGHAFKVMSRSDIEEIRDGSDGYKAFKANKIKDNPWNSSFDEMAKKTVLRRLFKYLPVSVELSQAVGLDEMADAGVDQGLGLDEDVIDITGEPEVQDPAAEGTDAQAADLKERLKNGKADSGAPPFGEQVEIALEENGLLDRIPALLRKFKVQDLDSLEGKKTVAAIVKAAGQLK